MGCSSSCLEGGDLAPMPLVLDPDDTCAICLEAVGDEEGHQVIQQPLTTGVLKPHEPPRETKSAVRVTICSKGGPWVRLDCGHVCHSACIEARIKACSSRRPHEKLTFSHLGCAVCREDLAITDRRQASNAQHLRQVLQRESALRVAVLEALIKHAQEDPIDRIDGIEGMPAPEKDHLIARRIGAFRCTKCTRIFCEGTACAAEEGERAADTIICPSCTLHPLSGPVDFSKCPEPLYKCDLCCSVAKYRCPDYYQCEKHHSGAKTLEPCPGGSRCPLGVEHPPNEHVRRGFIIGCGCGRCTA